MNKVKDITLKDLLKPLSSDVFKIEVNPKRGVPCHYLFHFCANPSCGSSFGRIRGIIKGTKLSLEFICSKCDCITDFD